MVKIFTDDPLVSYTKTTITPERTRDEISAILRQYDVADIHWHWKPEGNDVYVQFGIEEIIDGISMKVAAKVVCPIIWNKAVKNSPKSDRRIEQPNLAVSMRALYWYIKSHLESSYAMQSSRIAGFLPDMVTPSGERFFDTLKKRLDQFQIEDKRDSAPLEVEVIKPKPKNITYG
ncbi:hypothetical protein MUP77_08700 [Candidatus Bathyarchaeota archaeon]|nr:hypothetical protein [Candidatus Bathyarchaeota archaeon]